MDVLETSNQTLALQRAEKLLVARDYSGAEEAFQMALEFDPSNATVWRGLGESQFALNNIDAAVRSTQRALQLDPNDHRTLNNVGVMLCHAGSYEAALNYFTRSLELAPSDLDARMNLCSLYGRLTLADSNAALKTSPLVAQLRWFSEFFPDEGRMALVKENHRLRDALLAQYRDKYRALNLRVLFYAPSVTMGALFYIFESWQQSLQYMGIGTRLKIAGESLDDADLAFSASAFVSVDSDAVLGAISNENLERLTSAGTTIIYVSEFSKQQRDADLYITFHLQPESNENIARRRKPVISLPFAFNPLIHYAHPARTLWDFAFVGTNSPLKLRETEAYLLPVVRNRSGILAGVGWPGRFGNIGQSDAALLYNFAAICPNFHLQAQIETGNEVNERAHVLAACGAFQLCDRPQALSSLYRDDEVASAATPREYAGMFDYYLNHDAERMAFATRAMRRAWASYSQFHVLERLIPHLQLRVDQKLPL